jgi:hypothetical protein
MSAAPRHYEGVAGQAKKVNSNRLESEYSASRTIKVRRPLAGALDAPGRLWAGPGLPAAPFVSKDPRENLVYVL